MSTPFDAALRLHQQGRLDEAEAGYRRLIARQPAHFDALHMLGVIAGQREHWAEALELLTRARELRPDNPSVLNNLGNTLGSLGRHEEAVAVYDRAIALRPDDPKALRNRGTSLRALEQPEAALASFDAALAIKPDYSEALVGRAECLLLLHRRSQALETFQRALAVGKDVEQIHFVLASLGVEATPNAAPPSYVEALFDGYAETFESHLVGRLAYRTPQLLAEALAGHLPEAGCTRPQGRAAPSPPCRPRQARGLALRQAQAVHRTPCVRAQPPEGVKETWGGPAFPCDVIVDLGCGTGLCGPLLRPRAKRLVGVDLSSQMLAKAQATGCYDEVVHAELVDYLRGAREPIDLAVAADVFNYLGDLAPAFAALHTALRPGGLLAFSLEAGAQGDFQLQATRRFVHSEHYLRELIEVQGFELLSLERGTLREEGSVAVEGLLVVVRRRSRLA